MQAERSRSLGHFACQMVPTKDADSVIMIAAEFPPSIRVSSTQDCLGHAGTSKAQTEHGQNAERM